MATRMQQRRGTASQWTTANPILATGEIGFETDTGQFKIGDGTNHWADLSYFKNLEDLGGSLDDYLLLTQIGTAGFAASLDVNGYIPVEQLGNVIGDAPQIFNTLEELAGALQDADGLVQTKINAKADAERPLMEAYVVATVDNAVNIAVSDMTNALDGATADLNSALDTVVTDLTSGYEGAIASAISTEVVNRDEAIDSAIVSEIQSRDNAIDIAVSAEATERESSIANAISAVTGTLEDYTDSAAALAKSGAETSAQGYVSDHNGNTTNVHGIADTSELATKTYADNAVSTHEADTTNVHGIADTAALATKTYADGKASDAQSAAATALSNHEADTTNIHGIADTTALATKTYADSAVSTAVASLTKSSVGLGNVDNTSDASKPVSTATQTALDLKAPIANPTFTGTVSGITKTMVGLANVDNTSDANKPVSTATQTALDLKAPKASPTFTGTVTAADVTVTGNLTVTGTTTTVDSQNLAVTDSLIYLAKNQYSADALDIGIYGAYGNSGTNGGNHPHTGLIRDASDGKWKLISNGAEPTDSEVDFTGATKDTLVIGALDAVSATIGNVSNTELQYLDGVTSAIQTQIDSKAPIASPTFTGTVSGVTKAMVGLGNVDNTSDANKPISTATQTALDAKLASATASSTYETITNVALKAPKASPSFTGGVTVDSSGIIFTDGTQVKAGVPSLTTINQQSASYTPVLTDRDKLVEVSSASAVTVTIPANSSVAYPVGTSIDILQTGTGQITIAAAAGVTVNATPGLKLRTQWSSATLFKRATDTWVVFGDLSA